MTQVTLQVDGGFAAMPGLQRTVTVNAARLPPDLQHQLQSLVEAAAASGAAAGGRNAEARDARSYRVTITSGGEPRTISFADPVSDASLRALRDFVLSHGERAGA